MSSLEVAMRINIGNRDDSVLVASSAVSDHGAARSSSVLPRDGDGETTISGRWGVLGLERRRSWERMSCITSRCLSMDGFVVFAPAVVSSPRRGVRTSSRTLDRENSGFESR